MKLNQWAAPAALAVAVAGAPLAFPSLAQAATGTDSFTVYVSDNATGAAVTGAKVEIYNTATGAAVEAAPAVPDSNGDYSVSNLVDGTYVAKVTDPSKKHHDVYSTSATVNAANPGYVEARMTSVSTTQGKLKGTVTQTHSRGLDEQVFIFPSSVTQEDITSGDAHAFDTVWVDSYDDGTTQSADWSDLVPTGSYKVAVGHETSSYDSSTYEYSTTWDVTWAGGSDANSATVETVGAGATKQVGTVAVPAGSGTSSTGQVSGAVKTASGAPLSDVRVRLEEQSTYGGDTYWYGYDSDITDDSGTFSFGGVPAGTYTLQFADDDGEYADTWLGNKPVTGDDASHDGATTFTVTADGAGSFVENATLSTKIPVDHSSGAFGTLTTDDGKAHQGEITFVDVYGNYVTSTETHRDGTWSITAAELPPGQYKLEVSGYYSGNDFITGWYGGKTYKKAATLTVPVKGVLNAGTSKNQRPGSISGKITLPRAAGTDSADITVDILDAQGNQVDSESTPYDNASTTFSFAADDLDPGVYYVEATGNEWNSFDSSYDNEASSVDFINQFYSGRYTLGSAKAIAVGSGGVARNINITLGNKLAAVSKPTISGTPKVGQTLKAGVGSWNVLRDLGYAYTWTSNGKLVSHASSYKVAAADAGKTVTLTVTASDLNGEFVSGSASSSGEGIAKLPTPTKPAKSKKHHKKHGKGHKKHAKSHSKKKHGKNKKHKK